MSTAVLTPKTNVPTSGLPTLLRSVAEWLRTLHRVNPALSGAGWLHVLLVPGALLALAFDERLITGLNPWIKPLKFTLSGIIYLWSLGWLLADLPSVAQRAVRRISWGVAVAMVVETVIISLQAARGTTSHYNVGTALDGALFGVMGVFIMLNTALIVWALYLVWRHRPHGPASYVWGVRLGLLLFLVGSAVGGAMISHAAHTIGAPDGGPGLPGLGWSTRAGDLRVAHFLGLHSLQALPLLGWWASRKQPRRATLLTWLGAAAYTAVVALLYVQAMRGMPLMMGR
jgi:hypothetical protein